MNAELMLTRACQLWACGIGLACVIGCLATWTEAFLFKIKSNRKDESK